MLADANLKNLRTVDDPYTSTQVSVARTLSRLDCGSLPERGLIIACAGRRERVQSNFQGAITTEGSAGITNSQPREHFGGHCHRKRRREGRWPSRIRLQPVSQEEAAMHHVSGVMMRLAPSGGVLSRIG
jgi:hypothetical protein